MKMKTTTKKYVYFKRIVEIFLTIILCILLIRVLNYIYVNDCYNDGASWERSVIKEFYSQEGNIDCLFLGSSHVFTAIIPERMDELDGKNNFNLATPTQSYIASYFLLKEALKHNQLEHVYLEMYYMIPYSQGDLDNIEVMTTNWNVLYQLRPSFNKLNYMCHLANRKYGIMTFFPIRQFAGHVFDIDFIRSNLAQKRTHNYKNHIYVLDDNAPRFKKGFCTTLNHVENGTFEGNTGALPDLWIDSNSEKYLYKIIQLCQKEEIGLTLFTAPMPDFRLCSMGNYDQYVTEINKLAENHSLHYFDFNLCNTKYLDLQKDEYFMNYDHLGYEGAQLFTDVLGQVLFDELQGIAIPEDMFYSSYAEKLSHLDQRIFGLDIQQDLTQEQKAYLLYSVDNLIDTDVEFRVSKICEGETRTVTVQEWSEQNYVAFPKEESGIFIVEARPIGTAEVTNRVEINY